MKSLEKVGGMEILVAEDDPSTLRLLESAMAKWGFDIIGVRDGGLAWEIIQKRVPPPIAILDRIMPVMDGVTLIRKVRKSPEIGPIYIILLTGMDQEKDIVEGLHAGADDYMTKPFSLEELQVRVQVGVRIVKLERALAERVNELEDILVKVKRLQGLLMICTYCKRIRDEDDSWQPIEIYIGKHSDAEFSHGTCPECLRKFNLNK